MANPSKKPSMQRLIELQEMILAFHAVDRKVYIPPTVDKAETDVDHSYSIAMLAWFLAASFPHLDQAKIIQLCLAHDIIEVYSGDTFSFDKSSIVGKEEREHQAFLKLKEDWADFPGLTSAIDEYETCDSEEAKFTFALDKLQPAIMDYLNDGRVWHRLNITFSKFVAEKEKKVLVSPEIYEYYKELREILDKKLHLFPSEN